MAVLHNEGKNLRFFLELVDREVFPIVPGQPRPPPNAARVLGTVGVEFYDRRDQSYWPFIRLPVIYIGGTEGEELIDSIRKVCSLQSTGFAFRGGSQGELALQIGRQDDGGLLAEGGLDPASHRLPAPGTAPAPAKELALSRFTTATGRRVIVA